MATGSAIAGGILTVAFVVVLVLRARRPPETPLDGVGEALGLALDVIEAHLPGAKAELLPSQPFMMAIERGRARLELDVRPLIGLISPGAELPPDDRVGDIVEWIAAEISGSVGTKERARNRKELLRAMKKISATVDEEDDDLFVFEFEGRRCPVSKRAVDTMVWGIESKAERAEILAMLLESAEAHADDAEDPIRWVRPMFVTPGRDRAVAAVVAKLAREMGREVTWAPGTKDVTRIIEGLPFALGYVEDFGERVVRVSKVWIERAGLDEATLHEAALANLRADRLLESLPERGAPLVIEDREDYAASALLLVPEMLSKRDVLIAASPGPAYLVLAWEGDAPALRELRRIMDEADDGAPIPRPVRVTARGFEETDWASLSPRRRPAERKPAPEERARVYCSMATCKHAFEIAREPEPAWPVPCPACRTMLAAEDRMPERARDADEVSGFVGVLMIERRGKLEPYRIAPRAPTIDDLLH